MRHFIARFADLKLVRSPASPIPGAADGL